MRAHRSPLHARRAQGLPVFYAPGEAEAVCAALAQAGCVDAVATFDSDVLLYGAETVYQTLRLSVSVGNLSLKIMAPKS